MPPDPGATRRDVSLDDRADLPTLSFDTLRDHLLEEAADHAIPLRDRAPDRVALETAYGRIAATRMRAGTRIEIAAPRADWLHILREAVLRHLAALHPASAATLRWSDTAGRPGPDALPPNVRLARVARIAPLGRRFARVTLAPDDPAQLAAFTDAALHVRLCQPPADLVPPAWPRLGPNGATIWPDGPRALHRPAYTIRRIDRTAGTLDIDIFLHAGGRTADWVRRARAGDPVALAGPGGGGIPAASRLRLVADESGYPALARILGALPDRATGDAVLLGSDDRVPDYPLPPHPGIAVRRPGPGADLAREAGRRLASGTFLWAAGEKAAIGAVRRARSEAGLDPAGADLAAYWVRRPARR